MPDGDVTEVIISMSQLLRALDPRIPAIEWKPGMNFATSTGSRPVTWTNQRAGMVGPYTLFPQLLQIAEGAFAELVALRNMQD